MVVNALIGDYGLSKLVGTFFSVFYWAGRQLQLDALQNTECSLCEWEVTKDAHCFPPTASASKSCTVKSADVYESVRLWRILVIGLEV